MLSIYYQKDFFKDQSEVRQNINSLSQNQLSSIGGLSIDFLRQFKDRLDWDVIFGAPYNNYFSNEKIRKEFKKLADLRFEQEYGK